MKRTIFLFCVLMKTFKKTYCRKRMKYGKRILKKCIPPIIIDIFKYIKQREKEKYGWFGNYSSWEEASSLCTGYDRADILEKCKNALLKVKNGEAVYERDSVLFDEIQYSWTVLTTLQMAALENNGNLCVLDFGGSLGSSYFQNRAFLKPIKKLEWCIVEQQHFVTCGKENFENKDLKFYYTIEECMQKHTPDVILLSSVMQYIEKPYHVLKNIIEKKVRYIVVDITTFTDNKNDTITIQKVPPHIYNASYPCWFFNKSAFINFFAEQNYNKMIEWKRDSDINLGYLGGIVFKNKII